ncbi:GNAT family N-acetyltransferase [Roseomonas xinghualingensis]|uniref:GNAT family N-acetyltransferase n=1 Tax=Roseomonas xinghualingensis TaxID=2986475 RepID=UPI0021F1B268|nr:GNAT family N-acetyltransferase [Roseomonas sp. SXEYE001]MCV4207446.1 GNAT family N-acetyltransferase [Roseomonas sp. SXEYE001]
MIRHAVAGDAAALAAMLRDLNSEPGLHPDRITPESVARDLIGDPRMTLLVGEIGGAASGFVTAHPYYDSGASRWGMIVNDLYVMPSARRRGLIGAMAGEALLAGGSFLWWDADHGDALAQAFHRSLGAVDEPTISFLLDGAAFHRWAASG